MVKKRGKLKKQSKQTQKNYRMPLGIEIISILFYIVALINIIIGTLILLNGLFSKSLINLQDITLISSQISNFLPLQLFASQIIMQFIFVLLVIFLGLIEFFIAKDLWNGKNWARIWAIILLSIAIIKSILLIIAGGVIYLQLMGLIGLFLYGLVLSYLILNKKVKSFFK